ncbi:MAG: hypothetical protein JWM11_6862 [Planctomycetaceae bacterium]|nr:hypothetical protein [Planctomycetaceae bacterium]
MQTCQRTLSLLVILCVIGCGKSGPQLAAISGSVTIDNVPVDHGTITFAPTQETKGASSGGEIKDGKYSIPADKGPTFGKYRVEIRWSKKTGKQIEMGSPAPPGTKIDEVVEAIPEKYNSASTLVKDINSGKQVIDFNLEK